MVLARIFRMMQSYLRALALQGYFLVNTKETSENFLYSLLAEQVRI